MYARELDDREFTFGVSGKLIRNVLVMYDRQTESYWSQLLGEAVAGEMQGAKLEYLPSWHTTWGKWKEMHQATLALKKGFSGGYDPYSSYYQSSSAGVIGETFSDERLATKEFVIGVELEDEARAYPFRVLNNEPVVNDTLSGKDILIVFDSQTATGVAFDRQLGEQTLTFVLKGEDPLTLSDLETGSRWDGLAGVATAGSLTGQRLDRIKSTAVFWFGWKDFHAQSGVYGLDLG